MENFQLSNKVLVQLMSFCFWSGFYLWCQHKTRHSPEWNSRIVTLLHGSVAAVVGLAQCRVSQVTKERLTMRVSTHQYSLMVWSWGYFAFDLMWCLVYWPRNLVMLVHHAISLAIITLFMNNEFSGCCFACGLALTEITNPLLQARWFLKQNHHDKSIVYLVIEVLYLVTFIALRGFLGTYIVFRMSFSPMFALQEKLLALIIYVVSLLFINDIVGYVLYKYKDQINSLSGYLDRVGVILDERLI